MKLSIIVITRNNQAVLEGCLKSAKQAAEIIVVDDQSTDDTPKIAKSYTSKVFTHPLSTFAKQRAWGAKQTSGDWIMFLDADERLSSSLFQEIKTTLKNTPHSAFRLKRRNYFFGRLFKHSGYWPDWQTRLFKKSAFKGITGASHEHYRFQGSLGSLKQPLIHFADRRIETGLRKSILWTKPEAKALYKTGHPPITCLRLLKVMIWEFCYRYCKKQGWRDGYIGFVEAITQAINKFFIYQQVWELQQQKKVAQAYKRLETQLL